MRSLSACPVRPLPPLCAPIARPHQRSTLSKLDDAETVTASLAARTGTDAQDWFLVFKARYGMEVVARALTDLHGTGEAVTQILTCSTAVNPLLAGGLTCVYADVSPRSYGIDPALVQLGAQTRMVVLQHTFGIHDEDAAAELAEATHGVAALLLEDSAHCVGTISRDSAGNPLADVSVHSFGVEKMLPTRFGGALWVNPAMADTELRALIVKRLASLPAVGLRIDLVTRAYRSQVRVLNRLPKLIAGPLRSTLVRTKLMEPPISPLERRGDQPYSPMAPSPWMLKHMAGHLSGLAADEDRRAAVVTTYLESLADAVAIPAAARHRRALVRFPFLAADGETAERIIDALNAAGFYPGRWYRPAFFPGAEDPATYGYVPGTGTLTITEDIITRIVNLPTRVDVGTAQRIARTVLDVIG